MVDPTVTRSGSLEVVEVGPWVVFKMVEPGWLVLVPGLSPVAGLAVCGVDEFGAGGPEGVGGLAEERSGICSGVLRGSAGPDVTATLTGTGSVALEDVGAGLHCVGSGPAPVPRSVL